MILSSTLSPTTLAGWSRALHHGLNAGLTLVRVFRLQASKGPREARTLAADIALSLEQGESLEDILNSHSHRFPALFLEMAIVGEQTGNMVDVFGEMEEYYSLQQSLTREFRSQITLPVMQFVAGVMVVAALIWILGMIAETRGGDTIAPVGFGLVGAKGAIKFLLGVILSIAGLFAAYRFLTRGLRQRAFFEGFLLKVPAVGPCMEAFAMGRFCTALRLTTDSSMSMEDAVRQSLRATANAAFMAQESLLVLTVKAGKELAVGIRRCHIFPREFADILEVAELSGQIPETMIRQAAHYREEASRRLKTLTRVASFVVWVLVAIMMIAAIFSIANVYLGAINQAAG